MFDLLLHLSLAVAGGAAYTLAIAAVLIGLDKTCRCRPATKPVPTAARSIAVGLRRGNLGDGGDENGWRFRMN